MSRFIRIIKGILLKIRFIYTKKIKIGKKCVIQGPGAVSLICKDKGKIQLEQHVQIRAPLYLYSYMEGNITIGENCFFNRNCSITSLKSVVIGKHCLFGNNLVIIDHNHIFDNNNEFSSYKEVIIGNNVWVGANVTILKGVKIGDGAIIASGSVVNKNVEPYTINGGVPCKMIKKRETTEEIF